MKDMARNGPLAPSCHEKSGVFKVQSLMGQVIGVIGVKLRLTMIGPNILNHIPETLLSKAPAKETTPRQKEDQDVQSTPHQERTISVVNKGLQTEDFIEVKKERLEEETEKVVQRPAIVRRLLEEEKEEAKSEREHIRKAPPEEVRRHLPQGAADIPIDVPIFEADAGDCQDVRIPDIDSNNFLLSQPPPMFYNSGLAEPRDDSALPAPFLQGEKIIHESMEVSPRVQAGEGSSKRHRKKDDKTREETEPKGLAMQEEQLPMLNALLKELTTWKSQEGSLLTVLNDKAKKSESEAVRKTSRSKRRTTKAKETKNDPPVKEDRREFLRRLSSPRVARKPQGGIVPKTVGWLRSAPEFHGGHDPQLTFGTTQTQRMRAALHRPEPEPPKARPPRSARRRYSREARSPHPRPRTSLSTESFERFVTANRSPSPQTSPEPAPRSEKRRSAEGPVSQMERLTLRGTMDTTSHAFTSVEETELAPLKESESEEEKKKEEEDTEEETEEDTEEEKEKEEGRKDKLNVSTDFGGVINPIRSNRSPLVSGRVSNVPSMATNGSQSIADSTAHVPIPSRREEEFTQDEGPDARSTVDLNPDDTSEWRTSVESQYSPHKPPLPSRSFDSPSPRQRRRRSDGSTPTTPRRSSGRPRLRRDRSNSYSSFESTNSEDRSRETPNLFDSQSVMSSGTKVTPMTRGSTTKGSIFIPPISSARSESVSSYMPTDPDNLSVMSDESFSDIQ